MNLQLAFLIGLAAASAWKLAISDRITQWLRYQFFTRLDKAGGFIPYHLQYMVACALCFPLWASIALYFARNTEVGHAIAVILAARIIAFAFLKWMGETSNRDLPDGVEFPPRTK